MNLHTEYTTIELAITANCVHCAYCICCVRLSVRHSLSLAYPQINLHFKRVGTVETVYQLVAIHVNLNNI